MPRVNSSLDHLPARKKQDLHRLTRLIRDTFSREVEMIVLYGSYARGDYKEERDLPPKPQRKSGHASDYDILIITNSEEAAESIEMRTLLDQKAANLGLSARPRFIAYDVHAFNERLEEGRFFYTDIKREGIMLFDTEHFELAQAKVLEAEERHRIAKEYFEHWYKSATMFFENATANAERGHSDPDYLKLAAFHLHQAAEAAYKTILLVFTGYSPDQHWLAILADMASRHAPGVEDVIPRDGPGDESRLFKLLDYAYIGARYDAKYAITEKELAYLAERVGALLEETQAICTEQLQVSHEAS